MLTKRTLMNEIRRNEAEMAKMQKTQKNALIGGTAITATLIAVDVMQEMKIRKTSKDVKVLQNLCNISTDCAKAERKAVAKQTSIIGNVIGNYDMPKKAKTEKKNKKNNNGGNDGEDE